MNSSKRVIRPEQTPFITSATTSVVDIVAICRPTLYSVNDIEYSVLILILLTCIHYTLYSWIFLLSSCMKMLILCNCLICVNSKFLFLCTNLCTMDIICIQFSMITFSEKNLIHGHYRPTKRIQNFTLTA